MSISLTVNGEPWRIAGDERRSLLEALREDLGLTGTKYGCGEGDCRACTVLVNGEPRTSCRLRVAELEGANVLTIEGLARDGALHPVQRAFLDAGAMQCGYCVPGMILTTVALLSENARPSRSEVIDALNGNLCRCCGYVNILNAVEMAAASKEAKR